jgi:hypothetical protein
MLKKLMREHRSKLAGTAADGKAENIRLAILPPEVLQEVRVLDRYFCLQFLVSLCLHCLSVRVALMLFSLDR